MDTTSGSGLRLPRGVRITPASFALRHRVLRSFLFAQLPLLLLLGLVGKQPLWEVLLLVGGLGALALLSFAVRSEAGAAVVSFGLIGTSFAAIELGDGSVHMHLHLLSMVALVSLYQRWTPLLVTLGAVLVHHLSLGLLAPERVFSMAGPGMPAMDMGPLPLPAVLFMVLFHAAMVGIEVFAILLMWHVTEQAQDDAAREASAAQEALAEAARSRAASAQETATAERRTAEALSQAATQIITRIGDVAEEGRRTAEAVRAVEEQLEQVRAAAGEIAQRSAIAAATAERGSAAASAAGADIGRLETATSQIAAVNTVISRLAAQTSLLSLNATIEAARAGQAGRGFAVVAGEVKGLATETSNSVSQVDVVIGDVVSRAGAVAGSFTDASAAIADIGESQVSIAAAVQQQSAQLEEAVRNLSAVVGAADAVEAGMAELAQLAEELRTVRGAH